MYTFISVLANKSSQNHDPLRKPEANKTRRPLSSALFSKLPAKRDGSTA